MNYNQSTRPPTATGQHRSLLGRSMQLAGTAGRRLGSRINRYTLHTFNPAPPLLGRSTAERP